MTRSVTALVAAAAGIALGAQAPAPPADPHRRILALGDFRLEGGVVLRDAKLAYATFGALNARRDNAILLPSWYGADHHGYDFLIGAGRALDPARYFLVATEMFGNGFSSSPSNTAPPHDRARFPLVAIRDNVAAAHRLLTRELGVTHLRAVIGFSMGAQQAFQWAVSHPEFMDLIVPYCGAAKTYPHGAVRLESAIAALTADADFKGGDYAAPPMKGMTAWAHHWSAWTASQEWWRRELFKPDLPDVAAVLQAEIDRQMQRDPNNMIAQARTWQHHNVGDTPGFGGDLEQALRSIRVPVLYMPSQTDLYFPPEDANYEAAFMSRVTYRPIPSLWGHRAGGGRSAADIEFLNREIAQFLEAR